MIANFLSNLGPAFFMELALDLLLVFTLGYCILLERRLAAVRKGQEGLSRTIGELNMAIAGAGASLRALKAAAGEAAATLDERLKRARLHIDELSVLAASGERIAQRMECAATQRGGMESAATQRGGMESATTASRAAARPAAEMALPSISIMSRLERSAQ
ncbi:MAG: hypothetical protein BGN85_11790 [Alphaproteobacteria bacterium 64-11]|nr:hypothetical protein [Alphaproteobacteria bacterium]OJU10681.1 MAG: hypothetical protein BGN85_11790 [Alphaproteobacteria bacterium 64-11]